MAERNVEEARRLLEANPDNNNAQCILGYLEPVYTAVGVIGR